ncbi:PREDICTED: chondroitin sulfate proteoglycan 4-like [Nanorana parkeri]|uniref:chondroitin sulfate proteoglycan 4-like n=1 Tax=Nanorana parkeri TaxID=125878 RepID=UPI000854C2E6|nr:PREDICTED: chondroitin sulfate proteoglycan 4-like [Nanorana parkeri]
MASGVTSALCVLGALLCSSCLQIRAASFYGESYVELKTVESFSKLSFQLRFQTSKADGLLFLAAGKDDYYLVELHAGRVQIKINFGKGELALSLDQGPRLDDLEWHLLKLSHEDANVILTVDKHVKSDIASGSNTFNTQHGLYVGGLGSLKVPYAKHMHSYFRGCMDDVIFNEYDLLSNLRPYAGLKNVHEVSLGCSDEFFISEEDPISLFSSKSFLAFPRWNNEDDADWECFLQPSVGRGLLMYHSGKGEDFVSLEIIDWIVRASIGKGKNIARLDFPSSITENKWHYIKLKITSRHFHLTIGEKTEKALLPSRVKTHGPMYVGGISDASRDQVKHLELTSLSGKHSKGGSFKGCIKNIKVNSVKLGLRNVLSTKDISPGCKTEAALSPVPAVEVKTVILTTLAPTTSLIATVVTKKKENDIFITLTNLVVQEGNKGTLQSKHIKLNLSFRELGIRQSQILFNVVDYPLHGQLKFDVSSQQEKGMFTMLDLWHGRITYAHDGSEGSSDQFSFSVTTNSKNEMLPFLRGEKLYVLNITVTPSNDAPELTLPEGNLFTLLENSKKRLTGNLLKIYDVDSEPQNLHLVVLGNLNVDAGFLENIKDPEKAITTFSYSDLLEGNIYYVHRGVKNARLVLRVSDGDKVSNTVVLRILAIPLEFKLANKTDIEVIQGGSVLLQPSNLAVETNALNQDIEIKYDVTEMPKFGHIQRRSSANEWKPAASFTQRSLERERIRYHNTYKEIQEADVKEHFKFKITISNKSSEELIFPIKVKWLKYTLLKNFPLTIENKEKAIFGADNLHAIVEGIGVNDKDLFFKLESVPTKGNILSKNKILSKNSVFNQMDIIEGNVEYKLHDRHHEDAQDFFKFLMFTKYAQSQPNDFTIFIKADLNSIILTNKGLSLGEGETKLITKDELFVQTLNNKTFSFKVLKSPLNGKLKLINFSTSVTSNDNITVFSTQDILGKRLMYVHDNSETVSDAFVILASSVASELQTRDLDANPVPTEFTFNISIELKNDEKPIRVVDQLFHVVRNGQRLLTLEDLCYHDPDTDFDDGQLLYTRRGIPNGDLVSYDDTSKKLYHFTQDDLENKRVLFIHHGGAYGRFVLFVTDGKHYTSSLLEVTASEPFIKVINNTGLLVQKGKDKIITAANFSIETNMFVKSESDILYDISLPPKHGKIITKKQVLRSFTHEDLKNGHVAYRHDDSIHLSDAFNVTVKIDSVSVEVVIKVRGYLESHQRPPTVQNLKALVVEEGKPVKIDKDKLQVFHEDNTPGEMIFTVITLPKYGYIRRVESLVFRFPDDPKSVMVFTQEDINNEDIQYVQTEAGQLLDNFELDLTNGVREIMGITVSVDIIPIHIPLEVQNITVKEGASKALTQEYLHIPSKHFQNLNSEFVLLDPPAHGFIENTRFPGIKLSSFTKKQVEQELIYYVHDDSEILQDNFTIILNNTELSKQSLPQAIFVSVIPINDEHPVITANNIFRVWVGSVTEVTSNDLLAEDKDTPPADLVFFITPPSNGYLALKSYPNRSILNFTQQHINDGHLVFVHNGPMSGGFNFQVTDSLNFAPRQIFSITARTLVINLEVNKGLGVFPGTRRVISSEVLKAFTNDQSDKNNRTITFQVSSPPKHGRILKLELENATGEVTSFTQLMVDEGMILYEHKDTEAVVWSTQDSFSFTVVSPPAMLENQKFLIAISYEIDDPNRPTRLIANNGASVLEGQKIQIDKSKLDASNLLVRLPESQRAAYEVWFQVTTLPKHGVIIVGDRNITKEKPNFSQYIVNKFGITYAHNGAESPTDNFTFATWLNLKSKSAVKPDFDVIEEIFNIAVIPVNDQPPELKTKRPILRVLQGKMVALGPENLNVEDLDNPPEDITYTVISAPNNGFLAKLDNLNETIQHFTQADINNGDLWFVQDGSPSSGVFYFSVTDGKHKPLYKLFNLDVTPVSITLVNKTNLVLVQGQTFATVTNTNLAATTDGKSTVINFEMSEPPRFGSILINNTPVTNFDQLEIDSGKVTYLMSNFTVSQDSLELIIFTSESNLTGQVLNITVEPLVDIAVGLKIPTGVKYILKTGDLNATELATLTSSDPEYSVVNAPTYGRLVRRKMSKKDTYEDIEKFTHSDIEAGHISLHVDANVTDQDMINDSFAFMLKAKNVPPALGYFTYSVVPYDPALIDSSTTVASISVTTSALLYTGLSHEKRTTSHWLNINVTEAPIKRFGNRNRWGNQRHDEPTPSLDVTTTRSSVQDTTIKQTTDSPEAEPSQTNPLSIIIPLVVLIVLLLAIIFIVWFLLRKRRAKKAQPHVRSHSYSMVPQVPSPYTERSTTVPCVTVTPLQKPDDYCSASPLLPPRHDHLLTNSAPPFGGDTHQKTWLQMDPEMIQHCRKTNPTLKINQYWV